MHDVLRFSPRISCLPVVHGSGDFAVEVRRVMLSESFDCVAVPLPPSFRHAVEQGIGHLPQITIVAQPETEEYSTADWSPEESDPSTPQYSYVPIDPCQPVIAALRLAMQEHLPRAFIDLEVEEFELHGEVMPDPYALKQVPIEQFATAVLAGSPEPKSEQLRSRVQHMARRLRELEQGHRSILFVCPISLWPWLREAYRAGSTDEFSEPAVFDPELYQVDPATLLFLLGELPYLTGLYEQARFSLDSDENLSVDGVKEMLLSTREKYREELKNRGRKITPHLLATFLKYVRNLSLIERRMTPDLYTLITAAKQLAGDQFAISLAEVAREYPFRERLPLGEFKMSIERGQLPDGKIVELKNRLPGPPVTWRTCQLNRKPLKIDQEQWAMRWNPYSQCSWPPEDTAIERFRTHVKDRALSIMGNDLAKTEKFTTSLKDGLDIRETLRNWHTGNLYVKEQPPSRGTLDCVLMLFDSPADPRDYPWRITWHAEHQDESTLAFFATSPGEEMVGPGIAMATYGGAMFLFPPRPTPDVWQDRRFDFVDTLEERLLAAACFHSRQRHIAVMSQFAPGVGWRRLAKRYGRKLVHVPIAHFSQEAIQQLRMFHVLNGRQVRSYAEHFIRKA
ncbi:hypothetical protein [Planctomicrobium piriforme]|uniref:Uncharacterized protein n=1 Tax=Planctomicrobium piriforme TaxID=1576369 RepID=A0A1I3QAN9_9PLAN|nr:hypothetical protein [Planctomicrobium piriforme]SFJ31183.1 hypothetical protein SAMN05421753_11830 [Planctomicrobium piriforme]